MRYYGWGGSPFDRNGPIKRPHRGHSIFVTKEEAAAYLKTLDEREKRTEAYLRFLPADRRRNGK